MILNRETFYHTNGMLMTGNWTTCA